VREQWLKVYRGLVPRCGRTEEVLARQV